MKNSPTWLRLTTLEQQSCMQQIRERLRLARHDPNAFIEFCFTDSSGRPIRQAGVHRELQSFLSANPKALINGDTRGFVKILSDPATGVVLGGAIVGRNAAELISVIAVAVTNHLKVVDIVDSLLVHPALSESLADAAS